MNSQPINILLVEDNSDHADLIIMALRENDIDYEVYVVYNAERALEFLDRKGEYTEAPFPSLILLDIKLPGMSGIELLARIKNNPDWRSIPVVMLTTSANDKDIVESYGFGANSYVIKPVEFERFVEVLRDLKIYWLITNRLPG